MGKTVYAFNPHTGAYLGPCELDEGDLSPLDSTEDAPVYLIPGSCLESAPPEAPDGQWPFAVGGQWELQQLPKDPGTEPEPEFTVEERRARLKDAATARRWEIETGGLTLPNGIRVLTGKADQNRITSVIVNAQMAGIEAVDFKADSGWTRLTVAEITAIACAIGRHVQACFTAERVHHEAIDQLDAAGIDTYDLAAGWPITNFTQGA